MDTMRGMSKAPPVLLC